MPTLKRYDDDAYAMSSSRKHSTRPPKKHRRSNNGVDDRQYKGSGTSISVATCLIRVVCVLEASCLFVP